MKDNHRNMMSRNAVVSVKVIVSVKVSIDKVPASFRKFCQRHDIIYGVVALAVSKKSINATKISWFAQLSMCLHEPVFAGNFKVSFATSLHIRCIPSLKHLFDDSSRTTARTTNRRNGTVKNCDFFNFNLWGLQRCNSFSEITNPS